MGGNEQICNPAAVVILVESSHKNLQSIMMHSFDLFKCDGLLEAGLGRLRVRWHSGLCRNGDPFFHQNRDVHMACTKI